MQMILDNNQNNKKISYLYLDKSFTPITLNSSLAQRMKRIINPHLTTHIQFQGTSFSPKKKFLHKRSQSSSTSDYIFSQNGQFSNTYHDKHSRRRFHKTAKQKRKKSSFSSKSATRTVQQIQRSPSRPYNRQNLDPFNTDSPFISIVSKKQIQDSPRLKKFNKNFNVKKKLRNQTMKETQKINLQEIRPWSGFKIDDF